MRIRAKGFFIRDITWNSPALKYVANSGDFSQYIIQNYTNIHFNNYSRLEIC